jgi:DNA polymerase-3 subunit epsilon
MATEQGFQSHLPVLSNRSEGETSPINILTIRETTGLDPLNSDRIVEIGAVELVNRSLTGETFHRYVYPQRAMPADALAVHGLTAEFLADKPLFGAVAGEFLAFVGDAPLVAHNPGFDIAFINAELKRAAQPPIGRPSAWLTRWCWRGASIPADATRSPTCARAITLIVPARAHCSS